MVRSIWRATLLTAWAWAGAGAAWAQPKVAPVPATAEGAGPTTTICEPGMPEGATERPVRGFLNRLFRRHGESCSAASGETTAPMAATPPANEMHFKKAGVVTANMKSGDRAIMSSAPVSQPGDWRQSWGKADNHKSASLPQADTSRVDPLKTPEAFVLGAMDKKVADIHPASNDIAGNAALTGQAESDVFTPASPGTIPHGAGSVLAAGGGAAGEVVYVPVPVVTVPQGVRPQAPVGPPPRPPQPVRPPQGPPNGALANAFTTLEPGDPDANGMPAPDLVDANAFSLRPTPAQLRTNGFTNIRNPDPDYPAFGTSGMPMMAYPAARSQARYPGPYPMPAGPAMGVPYSPGAVSALPPATGIGVAQAGYARATSNSAALLATLHEALYPSQREYAADCLAASETKANTQVVDALMIAAKGDPAATVRAACVRCLTKMNVSGPAMMAMLHSLKADTDPRVRQAAEQALAKSRQ